MRRGAEPAPTKSGVLDAGIALARLDRRHRAHARAQELLERGASGAIALHMSLVNLAEVLQHSRAYVEAVGLDPVLLLEAFRVRFHAPDIEVARVVAELASLENASLADRFAAATTRILKARLYTTDRSLAEALRKARVPVTLY